MAGLSFESWGSPAPTAPAPDAGVTAPVGPSPPGGYPSVAKSKMTEGSAADSNDALSMAEGALDTQNALGNLRNLVSQNPTLINTYKGSDWNLALQKAAGTPAAGQLEQLRGAYNAASIPLIKQLYGAVPRSPEAQDRALSVLGGTNISDPATALALIDSRMQDGQQKINRALIAGRMTPAYVQQRLTPTPPMGGAVGGSPQAAAPLDQARAAIAAGAPRAAVMQRLQQNGIDPGGL